MANKEVENQAAEWLARLDGPHVGDDARAAFEQWRSADQRHAAAYARLEATWQWLDRVQAMRPPARSEGDPDFLKQRPARRFPHISFNFRLGFAAAAAVVAFALIGGWIAMQPRDSVYTTGVGGFQRVVLSDDSVVELNTDSEVRVHYGESLRKLELVRGEANFRVAHRADRPFVVIAGETAVRAVGTQFNVRRLREAVEVVVIEGKVTVGASTSMEVANRRIPASAPIIKAGQVVTARTEGLKLQEIAPEVSARKLAWQGGMLAFDGDSLAEVVAEFNRYNERQLVIDDPEVAALKIGGYFRATNLEPFVDVLEKSFGIQADATTDRIVLAGASHKK